MTDDTENPPIIDFASKRRERLHTIHDARLEKMRGEFERAFPLPGKSGKKAVRSAKKKKNPRKS